MKTPETADYLECAKANWNLTPAQIRPDDPRLVAAQSCALISIAESLRTLTGDQAREAAEPEPVGALVGYVIVRDAPLATMATMDEAIQRLQHYHGARICEVRELPNGARDE